MPRSRNRRPKPKPAAIRRGWNWRRAAGGWAELLRNFALLFVSAPFVEPLLTAAPLNAPRSILGISVGVALLIAASMLDHERRD